MEQGSSVTFLAQIKVKRHPNTLVVAGLFAALLLVAALMVYGVATGRRVAIFFTVALPFLVLSIKRASAATGSVRTLADLEIRDGMLRLSLPNTRWIDNGYIDQLYVSRVSDIAEIRLHEQTFVLSSHHLWGLGIVDGREVVRDDLGYGDVTVQVASDAQQQIASYIRQRDSRIPVIA